MPYSIGRLVLLLTFLVPILALLPLRCRRFVVLASSLWLYAAENPTMHLALLCAVTLAAYVMAQIVQNTASVSRRRAILMLGVVMIAGPLVFFKIATFGQGGHFSFISGKMPLGLAFVSLALVGYLVDVFRQMIPAQSLTTTFLFGMFFPAVPAGPIARGPKLMPQLNDLPVLSVDRFSQASRMLLWGIFLKFVIADRLALIVDRLDASGASGSSSAVIGAAYVYSFRLYADFSAYSMIAIGLAAMCGILLPKNFDRPYCSSSLSEFWRRWHISLSSWLKDYVYIPLGGSRVSPIRRTVNVLIVFLVSGFWHGGSFTFVLWGLMHGCWLVLEQFTNNLRDRLMASIGGDMIPGLRRVLGILITFHFVTVAWVVFRAGSLAHAAQNVTTLVSAFAHIVASPGTLFHDLSPAHSSFFIVATAIVAWLLAEWLWSVPAVRQKFDEVPRYGRWLTYYILLLAVAVFGVYEQRPFIYTGF